MGVSVGNYINDAQWDVCLHALCVGSGTTSLGVRILFVTSRRSARKAGSKKVVLIRVAIWHFLKPNPGKLV